MGKPKDKVSKRSDQGQGALRETEETTIKPTDTKTDDHISLPPISLTAEERAIADRAKTAIADFPAVTEENMNDFSFAITDLDLQHNFPEAWREQVEKRAAFMWIERTPASIDKRCIGNPLTKWALCTRTTTPFLSKYVDPNLGCIARLDVVLAFRPWDNHMLEKTAKQRRTVAREEAGKAENVAMRNAQAGVSAYSGEKYKIGSGDVTQYEDTRADGMGDLVVES